MFIYRLDVGYTDSVWISYLGIDQYYYDHGVRHFLISILISCQRVF